MSTFSGIYDAGSALNAARHGLDVISENIANSDTPGYTRQVVRQTTAGSTAGVAHIQSGLVNQGGVVLLPDGRMADPVLTARLRVEQSRNQLATTNANQLSQVERVFPEPSDTGLSEQMNAFWNAWAGVANDPGSNAARSVLLQQGATVASTLNSMSNTLSDITTSTRQYLAADVAAANTAASQLATLNGQIAVAHATGADANPLLDQRDLLLTKLSTLVGGVATINANDSADVTVGGQSLVSGLNTTTMTFDNISSVSVGATPVVLTGGSGAAETAALTTTLPGYQSRLDTVATTLMNTVNSATTAGFDLNGNAGVALFSGTGASDIAVAVTNPALVAASASSGGNLDGSVAQSLFDSSATAGGANDLYAQLVADVGSASAGAQQLQQVQGVVTSNVQSLQTSVSGVSTDEEVSSMLAYQTAYSAASRVLTTVDSMLDTLINHTGLVGRA